jgi:2-polyprenyl-6-methoxyphenol hydroxylase-like FAD-dependent oxidoreductase
MVVAAGQAGPCKTYPGDDTWAPAPFADGVVLIGDAAGWNDPIIGQGLSIAMRDARMVRDLLLAGAHRPADFASYAAERTGRMQRVRLIADVMSVTQCEPAHNREQRRAFISNGMDTMDPVVFPLVAGIFAGPETVPDQLVDTSILDRIRAA